MTDSIGRELKIGDYVTAMWDGLKLELFEVDKIDESRFSWSKGQLILKRKFRSKYIKSETNSNPVRRKSGNLG